MSPTTPSGATEQQRLVVQQLRTIHTMKGAALRMFDPMLAAVEGEQKNPAMTQVVDLLGNMLGAFGEHRTQTAAHERALLLRLQQLDGRPLARLARRGAAAGAFGSADGGAAARGQWAIAGAAPGSATGTAPGRSRSQVTTAPNARIPEAIQNAVT